MAQQIVAETDSFESISISSSPESIRQLDEIFSIEHANRRQLVKNIQFTILLAPISGKRMKKLQSSLESAANDAVVSRAFLDLFQRLHSWGTGEITLVLNVVSPSDTDQELYNSLDYAHYGSPIWEVRNHFKYLNFNSDVLPASGLPVVRCITALDFESKVGVAGRRMHPNLVSVVAGAVPNAKAVRWGCLMPSRRLDSQRRELRRALAQTLQNTPFDSLVTLNVYLEDTHPLNESFNPGSFCEDEEDDDLSLAVCRIFQLPAIANINLSGHWTLAPAVFRTARTFGRALEVVTIESSGLTPDGRWLNTGDEEEGLEDDDAPDSDLDSDESEAAFDSADSDTSDFMREHEWEREAGDLPWFSWRNSLDDEVFVPHALDILETVRRMPALRSFGYEIRGITSPVFVEYFAPGVESRQARTGSAHQKSFEEDNVSRPRWYLTVLQRFDKAWRVPSELVHAVEDDGGCIYFHGHGLTFVSVGDGKELQEVKI